MSLITLRKSLGHAYILINSITFLKPIQRNDEEQLYVNLACQHLSLYQFDLCPCCLKIRRYLHQLDLPIACKDIEKNIQYRHELEQLGGLVQVPCLRINKMGRQDDKWLYESDDIIVYLRKHFSK